MFSRLQDGFSNSWRYLWSFGGDPNYPSDQYYSSNSRLTDHAFEDPRTSARRKTSLRKSRSSREGHGSDGVDMAGKESGQAHTHSSEHPVSPPVSPPVIPPVYPDPPNHASTHSVSLNEESPILFYNKHEPYYEFTNFAPSPIKYKGKVYPTAEHLFQASKFLDYRPEFAERIRNLPSSREALNEAQRIRRLQRPDWFKVNIQMMDDVLEAKFTQHPQLRERLLSTGDCELVEDSPYDAFWGVGSDGKGQNNLGKALMRLRSKLRHQVPTDPPSRVLASF